MGYRPLIQVWPASPVFSNREGKVYFVGGVPSPGIVTSQGVVLTMTFRAVAPGNAQISFGERTHVFANDGLGTNILGQQIPAFLMFAVPPPQGPAVYSPTHPDQERWHRDPSPTFVWTGTRFADGYAYAVDRDPSGSPDAAIKTTIPTASFQNLENGIWYFHLRERAGGVWGGVSHYVIKIDHDPPASFTINISPGARTGNRNPIFRFFTTDAISGLDHFEMKLIPLTGSTGEGLFFEVASPYQALDLKPGRYQIILRAVDKAGNAQDEAATLTIVSAVGQFTNPEGIDLGIIFLPWSGVAMSIGVLALLLTLALMVVWIRHGRRLTPILKKDFQRILHKKSSMDVWIFFLLAGTALFFLLPSSAFAAPLAPAISVAPLQYYPLDETLYLEGASQANTPVDILFEPVGSGLQPVRRQVSTNSRGEWFLSERVELATGEWMARARVGGDTPSDWSNPRIIRSVVSGFMLGSVRIAYLPIILALLALFIVSGGLLTYAIIRVRHIRRQEQERAVREKTEALEQKIKEQERKAISSAIEENLTDIRREVAEELSHRENNQTEKRKHTPTENQHADQLIKKLRDVQETIEEKVKDLP